MTGDDFGDYSESEEEDAPSGSKRKKGSKPQVRRHIKIEYIHDKGRRAITFGKRKTGIIKKAHEISILTGCEVLLLVASADNDQVYTFATTKLQPLTTDPAGRANIQNCLRYGSMQGQPESPSDSGEVVTAGSAYYGDPQVQAEARISAPPPPPPRFDGTGGRPVVAPSMAPPVAGSYPHGSGYPGGTSPADRGGGRYPPQGLSPVMGAGVAYKREPSGPLPLWGEAGETEEEQYQGDPGSAGGWARDHQPRPTHQRAPSGNVQPVQPPRHPMPSGSGNRSYAAPAPGAGSYDQRGRPISSGGAGNAGGGGGGGMPGYHHPAPSHPSGMPAAGWVGGGGNASAPMARGGSGGSGNGPGAGGYLEPATHYRRNSDADPGGVGGTVQQRNYSGSEEGVYQRYSSNSAEGGDGPGRPGPTGGGSGVGMGGGGGGGGGGYDSGIQIKPDPYEAAPGFFEGHGDGGGGYVPDDPGAWQDDRT